jgi:dolichol-phosphate mannosyltransferase
MFDDLFLTVSIPAYNDSISLRLLVNDIQSYFKKFDFRYGVLIINDGSSDATHQVIEELKVQYTNVSSIHHEQNLGFGKTLKKVFTLPKSEWILFLPGDYQFTVENIDRFLMLKNQFDFMIGFRKTRKDNINRKLYSYVYNKLISSLFGYEVHDVNSIVFFKTSLLKSIILSSSSAFIHAELFIKMMKVQVKCVEIEVIHKKRAFGFGAGANLNVIFNTLKDLIKYKLKVL